MKLILISCSMSVIDEASKVAEDLRKGGFEVQLPTTEKLGSKRAYIDYHMGKLRQSDALLLVNIPELGSKYGRVGASGFIEVGWAYALDKPAYYINELDPDSPYTEDIEAVASRFNMQGGNDD